MGDMHIHNRILASGLLAATVTTVVLSAQSVSVTKESPTKAKLALIDTGSVRVQASLVARYGKLLDTLEYRCFEDRACDDQRARCAAMSSAMAAVRSPLIAWDVFG